MSTPVRTFEDLDAWRKARVFATTIHKHSAEGSFARDTRMHESINASTGALMDSLAEGHETVEKEECLASFAKAKAASVYIRSQLYRALDRHHISDVTFQELFAEIMMLNKLIANLMNGVKKGRP